MLLFDSECHSSYGIACFPTSVSGIRRLLALEERMDCFSSRANLFSLLEQYTRRDPGGFLGCLFFKWTVNFLCSVEITKINLAKATVELLVTVMVRDNKVELCFTDLSR